MKCQEFKKFLKHNPVLLADTALTHDFQDHMQNCAICQHEYRACKTMLSKLRTTPVPQKSTEEWKNIHDSIINKIEAISSTDRKTIPFRFRTIYPYAVAALLLLSFFSFYMLKIQPNSNNHTTLAESPKIIDLQGSAFTSLSDIDQNRPLNLKTEISEGNILKTGSGSSLILQLDQASIINLKESSSLAISTYNKTKQLYTLDKGQIDVQVSKRKPEQTFKIITPNASCQVVGTRFNVSVNNNPSTGQIITTLTVNEGRVLFSISDSLKVYVDSGKTISAVDKTLLTASRTIDSMVPNKTTRKKAAKEDSPVNKLDNHSFDNTPAETHSGQNSQNLDQINHLINSGNLDEALKMLSDLGSSPSISAHLKINVLQKKAVCWKRKHEFKKAINVLDSIFISHAATKSQKETALFQIASIRQSDLNDFSTAIEDLKRYLEIFPDGIWAEETMYSLAELYYLKKQFSESAQMYRKFVNTFSRSTRLENAIYTLARIYSNNLNNCDNALNLYVRLENEFPKSELTDDAVFWKAECLYHQGRINQALDAFRDYLDKYPTGKWITDAKTRVASTVTAGAR